MADEFNKNRDTELILPPGIFAFVLDNTKGKINTLCGPIKTSLSMTDQLVIYNTETRRFDNVPMAKAMQTNLTVSKGHYMILENPSRNSQQPRSGALEDMPADHLMMGQIENISGPKSMALWPGQHATVIRGHHLRSNQYLLVRVYDDEAAKANWDKSVVREVVTDVKAATPSDKKPSENQETKKSSESKVSQKTSGLNINQETLATGQLLVIKGTEVAFYIPPTGLEVIMDENMQYVREAVTLERLEYSILLDEDGNKEYVKGPIVVFPEPTQKFLTSKNGERKFRAFELQTTTGIHVKVIDDYEEGGRKYKSGEELFITGEEQAIYYPRPEHAIIRYGDNDKYYAIAIPSGEGRYVLDRKKGNVELVRGPNMFLTNPITQVVVRRILSDAECHLYYPGNLEALALNSSLREEAKQPRTKGGQPIVPMPGAAGYASDGITTLGMTMAAAGGGAASPVVADAMNRSQRYTPPRSIFIDSKYQGAVAINVFSGFAVQVVNSKGQRRTEVGPRKILLEYDETLERLSLSKGKPKSTDSRLDTVYLKHISNPVSDILTLKTKDLVDVEVQLKYLVRFEDADKHKWFAVDNYVQYMVDHLRSIIGNAVRRVGIQDFYQEATDTLRDIVLGMKTEKERPLRHFSENGMTVYDLEVISIKVKDNQISTLLSSSRQEALAESIELERHQQKLVLTKGQEDAKRKILEETDTTERLSSKLASERASRVSALELQRVNAIKAVSEVNAETDAIVRQSDKADRDVEEFFAVAAFERSMQKLSDEAEATKTKMSAVQPAFVEALVAAAHAGILEKVTPQLGALAFVNNQDLESVLSTVLKGTGAENILANLGNLRPSAHTIK